MSWNQIVRNRKCLKNGHKNGKNAKMNCNTRKYFTLKNVWKIIFEIQKPKQQKNDN